MPASLMFRDASSRDVFTAIARFANISLDLRPGVPRHAGHRRPAQRDARRRARHGRRRDAHVLPRHRAEDGRRHSRHAGQAARVRGRGRPHVLPEQRRSQGDDGPAAHGARRAAHLADDRHQRADDQGHAGAHRRRRRASSRRSTRRGPRSIIDVELLEVDRTKLLGVRAADRVARARPGINGIGDDRDRRRARRSRCRRCSNLTQSDILLTNLPALYYRLLKTDTNTRTLANPQLRTSEGIAGAGAVRRARAGAGDDVRADRHRRHAAAADHVVQLREHRREHRHHAAHAPRRRRVAGAEDRGHEHFGHRASAGCRRSATARSTR